MPSYRETGNLDGRGDDVQGPPRAGDFGGGESPHPMGGPARGGPKPPHPSSEREGALAVERGGEGGHQPLDTQQLELQAPEAVRGLAVLRGRHPGKRGLHSDIRGSI